MIASVFLSLASFGQSITHHAPELYIEGEPYIVSVDVSTTGDAGGDIPLWMLSTSAFAMNGLPLGKREAAQRLYLEPDTKLSLSFDLEPAIEKEFQGQRKDFRITFGTEKVDPVEVRVFEAAEKGIDFMTLPVEQLSDYQVVMRTSRGVLWAELWPDVAPNHVRNFLDLCYTGFYDGSKFHRVIPSFMIQGGQAKPGSRAPRSVKAEFNDRKHVPGVFSMARLGHDINSATSEFFIVHATSPHIDGNYSAFGRTLSGMDVVDLIAQSGDKAFRPGDRRGERPLVDQVIEKAIVVKAKTPPKQN